MDWNLSDFDHELVNSICQRNQQLQHVHIALLSSKQIEPNGLKKNTFMVVSVRKWQCSWTETNNSSTIDTIDLTSDICFFDM